MNFLYYLLESNIYILIFFGIYHILLSKLTFHTLNRYYLLSSCFLSLVLPFFKMTKFNRPGQLFSGTVSQDGSVHSPAMSFVPHFTLPDAALLLYAMVVLFLFAKFCLKLYKVYLLIKGRRIEKYAGIKIVHLEFGSQPFSFFRFLFLPENFDDIRIRKHEMIHIRQWHSVDVVILEIMKIINWFNPVISLMQSSTKLVHEFIVDDTVGGNDCEKESYMLFLINHAVASKSSSICSAMFGNSMLKRRILMMQQTKTAIREQYKYAILFLIAPVMIFCSSCLSSKRRGDIDPHAFRMAPLVLKWSKEDSMRVKNAKNDDTLYVNLLLDSAKMGLTSH